MKRSRPLRKSRLKAVGKQRPAKWAKAYGSEARVRFVKSLPCAWCATTRTERHNAHLPTKSGMGRKGPYTAIVPMCAVCHDRLDGRAYPRPTAQELETFWNIAEQVQADWLDACADF